VGVDTSIDEFFDEHLQRVLGASPATAEVGSWYPGPSNACEGTVGRVPVLRDAIMSKAQEKKADQQVVRHLFSKRPASTTPEPDREDIQRRAYQIYLARGATDGHALEDWIQAERELRENALH